MKNTAETYVYPVGYFTCAHTFLQKSCIRHRYSPHECIRQLVSAANWYISQGATFRVPLSILQRRKYHGGWEFIDVAAKCRALLLTRLWTQGKRKGSATAAWFYYWDLRPQAYPLQCGEDTEIIRLPANICARYGVH